MAVRLPTPARPYTAAQWSAIETAARKARADPLTKEEKAELCWMAQLYHDHCRDRELWRDRRWRGHAYAKRWRRLGALGSQALELLASLEREFGADFGANSKGEFVGDYHWRVFARPADWLRSLKDMAEIHAVDDLKEDIRRVLPKRLANAATRNPNAEQLFEGLVADFWIKLGGKLATSWDPVTKRVFGDFVSFFEAVARPVMKSKMPSFRSLPDIVRREKLQREAFRQYHVDANAGAR
jgi:hypothetical protein